MEYHGFGRMYENVLLVSKILQAVFGGSMTWNIRNIRLIQYIDGPT